MLVFSFNFETFIWRKSGGGDTAQAQGVLHKAGRAHGSLPKSVKRSRAELFEDESGPHKRRKIALTPRPLQQEEPQRGQHITEINIETYWHEIKQRFCS